MNPQYGFTGSVTLAVTGLPSGVTASFAPNPTTGSNQHPDADREQHCQSRPVQRDHHRHLRARSPPAPTLNVIVYAPSFTLSAKRACPLARAAPARPTSTSTRNMDSPAACSLAVDWPAQRRNRILRYESHVDRLQPAHADGEQHRQLSANTTSTITGTSGTLTASTTFTRDGLCSELHALGLFQRNHRPGHLRHILRLPSPAIWIRRQCEPCRNWPAQRRNRILRPESHLQWLQPADADGEQYGQLLANTP